MHLVRPQHHVVSEVVGGEQGGPADVPVRRAQQVGFPAGDPLDDLLGAGDLRAYLVEVQLGEVGVRPRVVADRVAVQPAADHVGVRGQVAPDHEERRRDGEVVQRVEHHRRPDIAFADQVE